MGVRKPLCWNPPTGLSPAVQAGSPAPGGPASQVCVSAQFCASLLRIHFCCSSRGPPWAGSTPLHTYSEAEVPGGAPPPALPPPHPPKPHPHGNPRGRKARAAPPAPRWPGPACSALGGRLPVSLVICLVELNPRRESHKSLAHFLKVEGVVCTVDSPPSLAFIQTVAGAALPPCPGEATGHLLGLVAHVRALVAPVGPSPDSASLCLLQFQRAQVWPRQASPGPQAHAGGPQRADLLHRERQLRQGCQDCGR